MDNSNQLLAKKEQADKMRVSWSLITVIILLVIVIATAWQYTGNKPVETQEKSPVTFLPESEDIIVVESEISNVVIIEEVLEEKKGVVENLLPSLDESDRWIKIKLSNIILHKNLLSLIINEDMIRRFVIFTDNFSQGVIAYGHSPFILPNTKFSPDLKNKPTQDTWQWNDSATQRFDLYIDLLRSVDSESLVRWYIEVKPLIDDAYSELGYEDDFTKTLQDAMTRVLDMELPKSSMNLTRRSVMYKFADPKLEGLPQADKLLLRLGKENLFVIKSILLELHEKLAQQENGVTDRNKTKDLH